MKEAVTLVMFEVTLLPNNTALYCTPGYIVKLLSVNEPERLPECLGIDKPGLIMVPTGLLIDPNRVPFWVIPI